MKAPNSVSGVPQTGPIRSVCPFAAVPRRLCQFWHTLEIVADRPRRLVWLVDSRDALREFPPDVRTKLGFGVCLAQIGLKHETAKVLHGFDVPVWEVRADDRSGTYRVVYVVLLRSALYALHAFQKKSKAGIATPKRDVELIRQRLKLARELDAQGGG